MPLTVLSGSFPSLDGALVDRLSASPPGLVRSVALVVPSQQVVQRLQRFLTVDHNKTFLNLHFYTFYSLALSLARGLGLSAPHVTDNFTVHKGLMKRVLIKSGMDPERARSTAGLYLNSVRDLLDANVSGTHFWEHFSDVELPGEASLRFLLELAAFYEKALWDGQLLGTADLAKVVAHRLKESPISPIHHDEWLYYGFYDLNGAQNELFHCVIEKENVTYFCPTVPGHPGWNFARSFLESRVPLGGSNLSQITPKRSPRPVAELLFRDDVSAREPDPRVHFVNVSTASDEVWWALKEIRRRHDAEGLDWGKIGVVFRDGARYEPFVQDLFNENFVPFRRTLGPLWKSFPEAARILALLRLSLQRAAAPPLAEFLHTGGSGATLPPIDVAAATAFLESRGPWAGLDPLIQMTEHAASHSIPFPPNFSEWLVALDRWLPKNTPRRWLDHLVAARTLLEPATTDGALKSATESLLEDLRLMDDGSVGPWSDFVEAFLDMAQGHRLTASSATQGVRLMTAMEARGETFEVLFLLGLVDGNFPRVIREDPLLSDAQRRFLRDPGGYWMAPKQEGFEEEKLLLTLLVHSVETDLYAVFSRSTEDGRLEIPSLYLRSLARAAGKNLEKDTLFVPRAPLDKYRSVVSEALTEQEALWTDVLTGQNSLWPVPLRNTLKEAETLGHATRATRWDGVLSDFHALPPRLSPTAVDRFVRCPFQFFAASVLRLRSDVGHFDDGFLSPLILGQLRHAVLYTTYNEALRSARWDVAELSAWAARALADGVAALERSTAGFRPLQWTVLKQREEKLLLDFILKDVTRFKAEGYFPERLEWSVEGPSPLPSVMWKGRLDRVDYNPSTRTYRLVDYKSNPARESLATRVEKGREWQVPIYLSLLNSLELWGPDVSPAGARFEYLATGESDELTPAHWDGLRSEAGTRLQNTLGDLSKGRFVISPDESVGGHCFYCGFARACRKAHATTRLRSHRGGDRDV